ncbi:uncharacterized protein LOC114017438 isoform X2 [Falco cherrug]|uniref:uncharacterized protein LOC114017438 isoform X2 n=1 Tax=Falco cherrug TaxID=345164 RepID=UPI00247B226A|nr:uncharacterized protein LOC114017438 isoform X2 [Falco cherrug]
MPVPLRGATGLDRPPARGIPGPGGPARPGRPPPGGPASARGPRARRHGNGQPLREIMDQRILGNCQCTDTCGMKMTCLVKLLDTSYSISPGQNSGRVDHTLLHSNLSHCPVWIFFKRNS